MTTVNELKKKIEALQVELETLRKTEKDDAVKKVLALVAEFDLTAEDIFSHAGKSRKVGSKLKPKVPPKYVDKATGATWSGRGLTPKWLAGKNKEDFLIVS